MRRSTLTVWLAMIAAVPAAAGQAAAGPGGAAPSLMAFAKGSCTALVNGTDIGCDGKAVRTVLTNGHQLFNFTVRDLTTIGFAGTKLLTVDPAHPSLDVERVYLDQNQYDADGSCAFRSPDGGQNFSHVECKALLRDGRKVTATLDGTAEPSKVFGATTAEPKPGLQAAAEAPKGEEDRCGPMMRMHGFLSRAQFQCGYGKYSQSLLDQAAACGAKAGEAAFKESVMSGMQTFDRNEKERGHKALCAQILKDFPTYVRR